MLEVLKLSLRNLSILYKLSPQKNVFDLLSKLPKRLLAEF